MKTWILIFIVVCLLTVSAEAYYVGGSVAISPGTYYCSVGEVFLYADTTRDPIASDCIDPNGGYIIDGVSVGTYWLLAYGDSGDEGYRPWLRNNFVMVVVSGDTIKNLSVSIYEDYLGDCTFEG